MIKNIENAIIKVAFIEIKNIKLKNKLLKLLNNNKE